MKAYLKDFGSRFTLFCWLCFGCFVIPLGISVGLLLLINDVTHFIGEQLIVWCTLSLIPLFISLLVGFAGALVFCRSFKELGLVFVLSGVAVVPIVGGVYIMGQGG